AISATPGGPAVAMTKDNVANRSYPLAHDAYIYVDKPPGRAMDPKVREFLRFVLSREGQEIIQKNGPYTNIPAAYIRQQLRQLHRRAAERVHRARAAPAYRQHGLPVGQALPAHHGGSRQRRVER